MKTSVYRLVCAIQVSLWKHLALLLLGATLSWLVTAEPSLGIPTLRWGETFCPIPHPCLVGRESSMTPSQAYHHTGKAYMH